MLFDKLAFFTDIHFGRSNNNQLLLRDDEAFVTWFIDEARTRGCKTCIFGGDWHDVRNTLQIRTMNVSINCMQRLNDAFDHVWWIPGNHDLALRESRDISSIEFARKFENITIIRDPLTVEDVTFLPWLVGDESKTLGNIRSRYVFAHLEVPGFLLNSKSVMQEKDHATKAESFDKIDTVFTGHFHMRQQKGNILYTGNTMPHDFNDDWDSDRGAMFMSWGKEPEFVKWSEQPMFRTMKLTDMLHEPSKYLRDKLTAKVTVDMEISHEEAQAIKESYIKEFNVRKIEYTNPPKSDLGLDFSGEVEFRTVDQIVAEGLQSVESNDLDPNLLVDVYRSLG